MPLFRLAVAFALLSSSVAVARAAQLSADKTAEGVTIKIDGAPFTEYRIQSGSKPIIWPIVGPTGALLTRNYPMAKGVGEKEDHIHHRSLWFTHGNVNGIDFWAETGVKTPLGTIKHREFIEVAGGETARVATRNDWLAPDGKRQLEDERHVVFGVDGETRWIDFTIKLIACDGPVVFGDTKEGAFGIRVNEVVKVDAKKGGKIVNADGLVDKEAWGKRSNWVDYYGPIDGKVAGVAILNHPSSFRYPTWWHVRTYGLFAANPFGPASFEGKKEAGEGYALEKGKSLTLRYKLLLHKGDEKEGKVAESFAVYAKEK